MTRYYLDTEFIEYPNTIDLVSIGIKCSDGRKYYAISSEFDESKSSEWVKENIISMLEPDQTRKTIKQIRDELLEFITGENIQFYAYYADYDWVVFCWIFGSMIDLPVHFPMYCRDLKQTLDETGIQKLPDPAGAHNALVDAEWNHQLHLHIQSQLKKKI